MNESIIIPSQFFIYFRLAFFCLPIVCARHFICVSACAMKFCNKIVIYLLLKMSRKTHKERNEQQKNIINCFCIWNKSAAKKSFVCVIWFVCWKRDEEKRNTFEQMLIVHRFVGFAFWTFLFSFKGEQNIMEKLTKESDRLVLKNIWTLIQFQFDFYCAIHNMCTHIKRFVCWGNTHEWDDREREQERERKRIGRIASSFAYKIYWP